MYHRAFKFVQIICAAAFLIPASASGNPDVHFVSPDIWDYPIVIVGGEHVLRYRDADATLFDIYEQENSVENLMSATERGDSDSAALLAAIADRVASVSDRRRIIDFLLERNGIDFEFANSDSDTVAERIPEKDLRVLYYLAVFSGYKYGVRWFPIKNSAFPPISYWWDHGYGRRVFAVWAKDPDGNMEQIQEKADLLKRMRKRMASENLGGIPVDETLLWYDVMLAKREVEPLRKFFCGEGASEVNARMAQLPDDNIGKRFFFVLQENDSSKLAELAIEGLRDAAFAMLAYPGESDWTSKDILYAYYLAIRAGYPYGIRNTGADRNAYKALLGVFALVSINVSVSPEEFLELYFFLNAIGLDIDSDFHGGRLAPIIDRVRKSTVKKFFECRNEVPQQKLREIQERGRRMAERGFYENAEFEKRFRDSLRERAVALKAKRSATAGTGTAPAGTPNASTKEDENGN